jgi:dolichol-phosphate mannosyltransferase
MALISIIIPSYNEEENLPALYERLKHVAEGRTDTYEFIFVDDGSTDSSLKILEDMASKDNRVKAIKFSRNFGSHAACFAGLSRSAGDACTFLSADLQDPPEMIETLVDEWRKGYQIVIGVRQWEKDAARLFPNLYYKAVRRFALKNMPAAGTDVFLIDRKVVDTIVSIQEKNTSIFGLILWSGFKQTIVAYSKGARQKGVSKWTLGKKIKLFIDTFVSFSYVPLRLISLVGILLAFLGFVYAFFIVFNRLFFSVPVEGWASLMVALLVVSGTQLVFLGILGEYLWRNFDETRKRPAFIIDRMIGFSAEKNVTFLRGGTNG